MRALAAQVEQATFGAGIEGGGLSKLPIQLGDQATFDFRVWRTLGRSATHCDVNPPSNPMRLLVTVRLRKLEPSAENASSQCQEFNESRPIGLCVCGRRSPDQGDPKCR